MFSKSAEYAFRALIYLAHKSDVDQKVSLTELAREIDSPVSFTAKIMQQLTRHQTLVHSSTGPGGGFYLTPKSRQKSLYQVLILLDEEGSITDCILGLKRCSETHPCPLHEDYKHVRPILVNMLKRKSIAELASEMDNPKMVIHNVLRKK